MSIHVHICSSDQPSDSVYQNITEGMIRYRVLPYRGTDFNGSNMQTFHKLMWPQTRQLLDDFYRPYNEKLATLLGDDRFKFNRQTT